MKYKELQKLSLEAMTKYAKDMGLEIQSTNKHAAIKEITAYKRANSNKTDVGLDLAKDTFTALEVKMIDAEFRKLTGRCYGIITPATVKSMVTTLKTHRDAKN